MAQLVAIVEDDLDQRENYADALVANGYEVLAYANEKIPDFINSGPPWVSRTDSYLDYKTHRKPVLD